MERIVELVGNEIAPFVGPTPLVVVVVTTLLLTTGLAARIIEALEAAFPQKHNRADRPPANTTTVEIDRRRGQHLDQRDVVWGRVGTEGLELAA